MTPGELVVVGQGYVGLPLAQEAVRSGIGTIGLDANEAVVNQLNNGVSHVDDLSDNDVREMLASQYVASSDASVINGAKVVVICVPTPLSKDGSPDMTYVKLAVGMIAENVSTGTLICLESTTYPGTTEDLIKPALERKGFRIGEDLHLAYSPERINPGDPYYGFRNTPKVVGGITKECTWMAEGFYSKIVDKVVCVSGTREAEMTKLIENTYRHVNIALVNELAQAARGLKVDLIESINAAKSKPFGYEAFYPGPGVGGHCIPIDPNYLSYTIRTELGHPFRFVELAQEVNNSMPSYVVSRVADILNDEGLPLKNSKVLMLGVTYKSNIADQRESPAVPIGRLLAEKGVDVQFHDPHVEEWKLFTDRRLAKEANLDSALDEADLIVLLQHHRVYSEIDWMALSTPIFDTRGVLTATSKVHTL